MTAQDEGPASAGSSIPVELTDRPQWVCWRYETVPDREKPTKVPYRSGTGVKASSTDPATWSTYEQAVDAAQRGSFDGVGFVVTPDDDIVGVDFDDAISADGMLKPGVAELVEALNSYTEVSPSGRGLRVFAHGTWGAGRKWSATLWGGDLEVYDRGRFLTVTGRARTSVLELNVAQDALDAILAHYDRGAGGGNGTASRARLLPGDAEIVARAGAASNGEGFAALWAGDTSLYGGDESRADLALTGALAFWAGPDVATIDRVFRASGLMRAKWDERRGQTTYGGMTIAKALQDRTEFYRHRNGQDAPRTPAVPSVARARAGRLVYGHRVKLTKPKWLVPGRIPLQGITLVSGDPGQGKSSYTCLIAAAVTQGAWGGERAAVVFASAEDSFAGRIVQRAVAAGADRSRVAAFDIVDEHGGRNMELPEDVTELAATVAEIGARLVIVDPLNAHLSTALDSFKDHGIRKALAPLARMADELELACVVVCHLNKDKNGQPLYRTGGSIGYVGAARSVLGFGPDPEDEEGGPLRLLEHVKSNWSELAATEQYRMEAASVMVDDDLHDTNRLVYVGEVERDAGAAFGKRAPEDRGGDAEEAIAELLASGPRASREVKTAVMGELSCSERTVIRAAKRMEDAEELIVETAGRTTNWRLVTRDTVGPPLVTSQQSGDENPAVEPNPVPAIGDTPTGDATPVTNRDELRNPSCTRPEHRTSDWAMPNARMWICGVCHPPTPDMGDRVRWRKARES